MIPLALVALVSLLAAAPADAEPSRLERLEAEVAYARVSAARGVTLVDLYADW